MGKPNVKVKTVKTPKGFKITDIDRIKEGVTIIYRKKAKKMRRLL